MGILSFLGFTENKNEKRARQQMEAATHTEQRRTGALDEQAASSRGRYTELLGGFDPRSYMREAAEAEADELGEMYNEGEGQRRLSAQRSGFINSGGGIGRLNRDFSKRLARALSGLSLQTAGLEQGRIDRFGDVASMDRGYAENSRDRSLDLLAGARDAAVQSRNSRLRGTMGLVNAGTRLATGGIG